MWNNSLQSWQDIFLLLKFSLLGVFQNIRIWEMKKIISPSDQIHPNWIPIIQVVCWDWFQGKVIMWSFDMEGVWNFICLAFLYKTPRPIGQIIRETADKFSLKNISWISDWQCLNSTMSSKQGQTGKLSIRNILRKPLSISCIVFWMKSMPSKNNRMLESFNINISLMYH